METSCELLSAIRLLREWRRLVVQGVLGPVQFIDNVNSQIFTYNHSDPLDGNRSVYSLRILLLHKCGNTKDAANVQSSAGTIDTGLENLTLWCSVFGGGSLAKESTLMW